MADASLITLIALLLITTRYIRYVESIHFYDELANAWQFTLWSMHAAPLIALRLFLTPPRRDTTASTLRHFYRALLVDGSSPPQPIAFSEQERHIIVLMLGVAWIVLSWCCRRRRIDTPWHVSFVGIEAMALVADGSTCLSERWLSAAFLCQLVIVVGFWAAMVLASFSTSFSFLPLDRHLHRGWRHVVASSEARKRVLHDMVGHGLMQATFARILQQHLAWSSDTFGGRPTRFTDSFLDAARLISIYCAVVVLTAAVADQRLPYVRKPVPRILSKIGKPLSCFLIYKLLMVLQS